MLHACRSSPRIWRLKGPDATVKVEMRVGGGSFGRGATSRMRFCDFLARYAAGDASVYMTAQDVVRPCSATVSPAISHAH